MVQALLGPQRPPRRPRLVLRPTPRAPSWQRADRRYRRLPHLPMEVRQGEDYGGNWQCCRSWCVVLLRSDPGARVSLTRLAFTEAADVLLTVPAAWDAAGCAIMREAAIKAGLVQSSRGGDKNWRDRLRIITCVPSSFARNRPSIIADLIFRWIFFQRAGSRRDPRFYTLDPAQASRFAELHHLRVSLAILFRSHPIKEKETDMSLFLRQCWRWNCRYSRVQAHRAALPARDRRDVRQEWRELWFPLP